MQLTSLDRVSFTKPSPVSSTLSFSCTTELEPLRGHDDSLAGVDAIQTGAVVDVVTITTSDITTSADATTDG